MCSALSIVAQEPFFEQLSPAVEPIRVVKVDLDSGFVENADSSLSAIYSDLITVPGAPWVVLRFEQVLLSGDPNDSESFIEITSILDGDSQRMYLETVEEWQYESGFFNGDSVLVEVFAHPGTGVNRLIVGSVITGIREENPLADGGGAGGCAGPDPRIPSFDNRVARLVYLSPLQEYLGGCTAFRIQDGGNCFLSAGHCHNPTPGVTAKVHFNVPLSSPTGQLGTPHIADQFPVDAQSRQFATVIGDWMHFGVFRNSNWPNYQMPYDRYGPGLALASSIPDVASPPQGIRSTGYGIDSTPSLEYTRTQQTDSGPYCSKTASAVWYDAYSIGGLSGSPVFLESTQEVIGIAVGQGCNCNFALPITWPGLQDAINNPLNICIPFRRGDANNDGVVNGADAPFITNWLFSSGPAPPCLEAADANDDTSLNVADASYIMNWFFGGGPAPPAPGPFTCGPERAANSSGSGYLSCGTYTSC